MRTLNDLVHLLDPRNDLKPLSLNDNFIPQDESDWKKLRSQELKGGLMWLLGFSKIIVRAGGLGLLTAGYLHYAHGTDFEKIPGTMLIFMLADETQYALKGIYKLHSNKKRYRELFKDYELNQILKIK